MGGPGTFAGFGGGEDGHEYRFPYQLAAALDAVPGDDPLRVLDLGSASGPISIWLAQQNPRLRVTGVENLSALLDAARRNARLAGVAVEFVKGDVTHCLPAGDGELQAVVIHRLRDSIVTPALRFGVLCEVARTLRPTGLVSLVEDMLVEPGDPHDAWYARRYRVHRQALTSLLADPPAGLLDLPAYSQWLDRPDAALLMSLRTPDGRRIDEAAFNGHAQQLADAIRRGEVLLRGVGIHESRAAVSAQLSSAGLDVEQEWQVEIPEPPPREPYATVMKGMLARRRKGELLAA